MISKMITIKELKYVNLDQLSIILKTFGIEELNIFSINNQCEHSVIKSVKGAKILYTEMSDDLFKKFLNSDVDFSKYNRNSLYILRSGDFLDIKNLFTSINGFNINIGRGGSQKAHVLSPLDLRLSAYMMAMSNCNYKLISSLNTFYDLSKDRYLSYTNKYFKPYKQISINHKHLSLEFKPVVITKMPLYSGDPHKFLDCSDIRCPKLFNKNI